MKHLTAGSCPAARCTSVEVPAMDGNTIKMTAYDIRNEIDSLEKISFNKREDAWYVYYNELARARDAIRMMEWPRKI